MTNAEVVTETFAQAGPEPWTVLPDGEFAIVELFGHTTLVGRVGEVERFGARMLSLEPIFDGKLLSPVFHGGAAIYRFTPCSRQVAWEHQARSSYDLPAAVRAIAPPLALAAPEDREDDYRPF